MKLFNLLATLLFLPSALSTFVDCGPDDVNVGPYKPVFNSTIVNGTTFYTLFPSPSSSLLPIVVFMHGSTGQWEFYADSLNHISSHGSAIFFPFVKSPEKDKSPFATNTDGTYLLKSITLAKELNSDPTSPFYHRLDTSSVIIAGHSMGATCAINAASLYPSASTVVALHPGICGPFGPPPCPSCWRTETLGEVGRNMPVFLTTATNDGAFWPAPHTAEHEYGCFKKSVGDDTEWGGKPALFAQWNSDACAEDGEREPVVKDGGHNCPMKRVDGGLPEMSLLLKVVKLYGQMGGDEESDCYRGVYGEGEGTLRGGNMTDVLDFRMGF